MLIYIFLPAVLSFVAGCVLKLLLVAFMFITAISSCLFFPQRHLISFFVSYVVFLHQFPFCQILRLLSQPILVRLPGISVSILLISWYIFFRVLIFNNSVFKIKCVFLGHGLLGLVFLPNVRVSLFSLISFTHLPLL